MNQNGCYIDLHAHLDGSVTVDIAKKLAALQNIALPTDNDEELLALLSVPDSCESLNDFLKCFDLPGRLMQTPEGLQNAVTLVLENMAQDGVIYAELRFAPQFHTLGGMTQEQAVQAAVAGLKNALIDLIIGEIQAKLLFDHFTISQALNFIFPKNGIPRCFLCYQLHHLVLRMLEAGSLNIFK